MIEKKKKESGKRKGNDGEINGERGVPGHVPALSLVSGEGGWQASGSGPGPGHTLCHAAQEKPQPEKEGV